MYFAQQNQLKEYGLPIVYDTFVARKHGPVPTLTYKVLRGVEGKTEISSELKDFAASLDIELSKEGHQLILASKNAVCDMDELSVADVKMLDKWIAKCKDVDSFDLSDKSHEDKAWKRAKRQADKRVRTPRLLCMTWLTLLVPARLCWPLSVSASLFKRLWHGFKGTTKGISRQSSSSYRREVGDRFINQNHHFC